MQNVKQKTAWIWQNAEMILIVVFFLTFSFNVRKVFLTPYSFLNGRFNEYMTISFSWADLLMLAIIIIYTTKLIISQVINSYYTSPGQEIVGEKSFNNVSRETLFLLIFLAWVGISIFWSQYKPIAIYRFLSFAEILLFAIVAVNNLRNRHWLKIAVFALVLNGLFQSFLGIAQFIHNGSLGFHFLGESIIGPNIDGVAKIIISGEKHVRVYGTFPHPNILAGFLLIPLFLILGEIISRFNRVSHETFLAYLPDWLLRTILLPVTLAFGMSLSRSAFLGLLAGLAIYFLRIPLSRLPIKMDKANLSKIVLLVAASAIVLILLINNTSFFSNQSFKERQLYKIVSYETISRHAITGVGVGQFVLNEFFLHPNLATWQYQPVHDAYLLIFSELGFVGFIFFLLWIFSIMKWGNDKNIGNTGVLLTFSVYYCIMFSFLVISFFDHYFWDIRQGTVIFTLPLIIFYVELKKGKLDKEL
jgi:hypothetical protein